MTIDEAIIRADRLRPNPYTREEKIGWLSALDGMIVEEVLKIHQGALENFSGYANIFGSVYAVALSMLWLYFCISIVFYGDALNHYLTTKQT